jgi:NAD(P)-dependent dehydrogenase (short-subunit alcohol dehydrogenase family)
MSLSGKTAVVTGGALGIGQQIARTFVDHGASVAIVDSLETEGEAAARELGSAAFFHRCDITDPDAVCAMMEAAGERLGRIDVLVNGAAYSPSRVEERVTVEAYPDDVFFRAIEVDVMGTFYCAKYAAQRMIRQGSGSIITIASVAGVVALRKQIGHVVGKAGIIRMTEALALELGPRGIRVNSISPGSMITEATMKLFYGEGAVFPESGAALLSFIPSGRPGVPLDVAHAALFLASDFSSYVNGHNLVVDGGWTCGFARDF